MQKEDLQKLHELLKKVSIDSSIANIGAPDFAFLPVHFERTMRVIIKNYPPNFEHPKRAKAYKPINMLMDESGAHYVVVADDKGDIFRLGEKDFAIKVRK